MGRPKLKITRVSIFSFNREVPAELDLLNYIKQRRPHVTRMRNLILLGWAEREKVARVSNEDFEPKEGFIDIHRVFKFSTKVGSETRLGLFILRAPTGKKVQRMKTLMLEGYEIHKIKFKRNAEAAKSGVI